VIAMRLSRAADALGARLVGADASFSHVSTDTRTLRPGDLFVALHGPSFDGHQFLAQAARNGACAVMVAHEAITALPQLVVGDTRAALGRLAALWREQCTVPLVAVTGSNGKTTTKAMIAAILRQRGQVLATRGNLNNEIGVPLTLLELQDRHQFAVVEMGANHAGEIAVLTGWAKPDVAVITNAAAAHLEGFGSIDGVARAKGEIFSGLGADGVAVINADDPYAGIWYQCAAHARVMTFGLQQAADVWAHWEPRGGGSRLQLHTGAGEVELELPLPGRHNVMNALAAVAAALAAGAELADVSRGLPTLAAEAGRLQARTGPGGIQVYDDTYNANPASLAAALQVLAAADGCKWLVLGDMAELGGDAASLHEQAGRLARDAGVERLYALGELSRRAVSAFGRGARHFDRWQKLAEAVRADWHAPGAVLVKGSRSMHMERVVEALLQSDSPATAGNGER
jgi:UDP-N-acetylmuramoyl-tripeptide--D-alanyl-D-alanine ligase